MADERQAGLSAVAAWLASGTPLPNALWHGWLRYQGYSLAPSRFVEYVDSVQLKSGRAIDRLRLANLTGTPVQLVGYRPSKTTIKVSPMPLRVVQVENLEIEITEAKGEFREWVDFYTDSPGPILRIWLMSARRG